VPAGMFRVPLSMTQAVGLGKVDYRIVGPVRIQVG